MKRTLTLCLALLLTAAVFLLPIQGAIAPSDPMVAEAYAQIRTCVGTDTPGAAVVLMRENSLLMREGFGYADMDSRVLVTPETAFELGRLSGVFVSLAVYHLAQMGRVSLTADIATYLPAEVYKELDLTYSVHLQQLLLGCAGFEGRTFDLSFRKDSHRFDTLREALLAQVPHQVYEPGGEVYAYSPFGIALAAYVVECVAEMPYEEYVTQTILTPLNMKDTVLNPTEDTDLKAAGTGHIVTDNGVFTVAARGGRSYAGLYPAAGAISTAADLGFLLSFLLNGNGAVLGEEFRQLALSTVFKNGIFFASVPALEARERAVGVTDSTAHFGASLWLDASRKIGAVVLTNAADSDLLALPRLLCGATDGSPMIPTAEMAELKTFEGVYATTASEGQSFVGRMLRKDSGIRAEGTEDGLLSFGDVLLRQIAPGVFAYAGEEDVAQVQFLLNESGEVYAVVTAQGESYLPLSFWEQKTPATLLYFLLLFLGVWFFFAGILSVLRYFLQRGKDRHPGFVFTLPLLCATLMAFCVLLQVFVAMKYGSAAFSSFFGAMSVLTLLFGIGATVGLLLSFMASLTHRRMPAKVARTAILFIAFLLLVHYWGLSPL